jgi:hypothetical protein
MFPPSLPFATHAAQPEEILLNTNLFSCEEEEEEEKRIIKAERIEGRLHSRFLRPFSRPRLRRYIC